MAKAVGSQLDFQKIPALNFVVYANSTAPSSPVQGQLWVDTSGTPVLKAYINGAWVQIDNTGVSMVGHTHAIVDVTGLQAALDAKADEAITISPGLGLTGGGDLTANRTLTVDFAASGTSSATKATRADDSRLADSRTPSGTAGGSLAGTYPNPSLAAGAVNSTEINAAIKDAVAATASLRTLGYSGNAAMPGTARIDQIAAPNVAWSSGSQRITNVADPTGAQDAATKAYVDATASGLDVKGSVRVASTANVTIPPGGTSLVIDGVTLVNNDRVLLKDQTTASQNGIYTVGGVGTSVTLTRATDADTSAEVNSGMFTFVEEGTASADAGYVLTTNNPITLATTSLTFAQFSGAGQVVAGNGLAKTGNTLDVNVDAASIEINADILRVKALGITNAMLAGSIDLTTKVTGALPIANGGTGATTAAAARTALGTVGKYAATLGALSAGVETTITHSLNTTDVQSMFRDVATGKDILLDWRVIDANSVGVTADIAYGASAIRTVVMG